MLLMFTSRFPAAWPRCAFLACVFAVWIPGGWAEDSATPSATRVAKWKDDKQAVFLLMFDDSVPSHLKNAVPELKKRGLVGTFYINPGAAWFRSNKDAWEKDIPTAGMVYGNHTMTHVGAKDAAHLETELAGCDEAIARAFPGLKSPRLVSFGRPGVKEAAWRVTEAELNEALARHHLISRPSIDGRAAAIHLRTADDMLRLVDKALAGGGVEGVLFHGVGGDWLSASLPDFTALLDRLVEKKDALWVTDPVSAHQYETEWAGAEVKTLQDGGSKIRLALSCKADPMFYDLPLTLVTRVPAGWIQAQVTQGARKAIVAVIKGEIRFAAVPGAGEITIQPQDR
jgi:peptidoglycan/xylan/chitin deacetylase (PgdA/CDA1 family)